MEGVRSIAVIGAGAAGLVAAMVLVQNDFQVTIFEQGFDVGGVWNYVPGSSAMYESLRTNLPKEIMAFNKENPIENVASSFPTHYEIQAYLRSFAERHNLRRLIKFGHKVVRASKVGSQGRDGDVPKRTSWCLEWEQVPHRGEDLCTDTSNTRRSCFDAVIVCNGHFSVPYMPAIPTLAYFRGLSVHSNQYDRIKSSLHSKVVLIVGTASSGNDIAKELLPIAATVHVSDRNFAVSSSSSDYTHATLPVNMYMHPAIREFSADGSMIFADGVSVSNIDVIIWCTGYLYDFPFLTAQHNANENTPSTVLPSVATSTTAAVAESEPASFQVQVQEGKRVRPLYQQLFAIEDPTLVFVGLPFRVVPFPLFYLQAEYVAAVFTGRAQLPPVQEQYAWLAAHKEQLRRHNLYCGKYHFLGGDPQWAYCRYLATSSRLMGHAEDAPTGSATTDSVVAAAAMVNNVPSKSESAGDKCKNSCDIARYIDLLERIYDDNMQHRPMYPGDSDSYRDRRYKINWSDNTWAVE